MIKSKKTGVQGTVGAWGVVNSCLRSPGKPHKKWSWGSRDKWKRKYNSHKLTLSLAKQSQTLRQPWLKIIVEGTRTEAARVQKRIQLEKNCHSISAIVTRRRVCMFVNTFTTYDWSKTINFKKNKPSGRCQRIRTYTFLLRTPIAELLNWKISQSKYNLSSMFFKLDVN